MILAIKHFVALPRRGKTAVAIIGGVVDLFSVAEHVDTLKHLLEFLGVKSLPWWLLLIGTALIIWGVFAPVRDDDNSATESSDVNDARAGRDAFSLQGVNVARDLVFNTGGSAGSEAQPTVVKPDLHARILALTVHAPNGQISVDAPILAIIEVTNSGSPSVAHSWSLHFKDVIGSQREAGKELPLAPRFYLIERREDPWGSPLTDRQHMQVWRNEDQIDVVTHDAKIGPGDRKVGYFYAKLRGSGITIDNVKTAWVQFFDADNHVYNAPVDIGNIHSGHIGLGQD